MILALFSLIPILILCFDARFAFIRNWVLKRLTLNLWVHRFQMDCEVIDLKPFKSCEISEASKNLQKHVHWTVPVGSREVTYFLFLNDVQKHIPCNLLNNLSLYNECLEFNYENKWNIFKIFSIFRFFL
jgi:hypothetical protein